MVGRREERPRRKGRKRERIPERSMKEFRNGLIQLPCLPLLPP
jgi:hypothetical protein